MEVHTGVDNRMEILKELRVLKEDLKKLYGIEEIAIFGSVARDEHTSTSDVDIVILRMRRKNGFTIARAKKFLAEKLNRNVDIGLYDSMNPFIRELIRKDMMYV